MSTVFVLMNTHLHLLVWSLVATLLVIYGSALNQRIRKLLAGLPLVARFVVFVVVCAVGYGWLSLFIVTLLVDALSSLSPQMVFALMGFSFITVGWLAQRHRLI